MTEVAIDSQGNVYESSFFEEALSELRKWDANGNAVWALDGWRGRGALAVDDVHLFGAFSRDGDLVIARFDTANGNHLPWSGIPGWGIVINNIGEGVHGLAVDGNNLFVSHNAENRVEIYDKTTGAWVSQFSVNDPNGIAVDSSGNLWVVNSGDRVTLALADGAGGRDRRGVRLGVVRDRVELRPQLGIDLGWLWHRLHLVQGLAFPVRLGVQRPTHQRHAERHVQR